jgi:aquaporin Z
MHSIKFADRCSESNDGGLCARDNTAVLQTYPARAMEKATQRNAIIDRASSGRWPGGITATDSVRTHWPEYLMEAAELALFMFLTCTYATVFQHPASPIRDLIRSDILRRAIMGLAIGATVVTLVMTPWGKQSGGHFNPAMTASFYRLGKVAFWDAVFYVIVQFTGATCGVAVAALALRGLPQNNAIESAITIPGVYGNAGAIVGEVTISFILMITVLVISNHGNLARYTPYFVGGLYAFFITFETPLSGMSMNPARSFGSAFHAACWHAIWIYFVAPTGGMLAAAEVFLRVRGDVSPYCAKLYHDKDKRCIFRHGLEPHRLKPFNAEDTGGARSQNGVVRFNNVASNKRRILCVDDEIVGTMLRGQILKEHGYSVAICNCPFAALQYDLSIFDLAVLDFHMPGLNGRELFLRMRASGARFPIVLLSGCVNGLSDEDRVLFARCLDKNMPIQYLLDTIAEFIGPNQIPDWSR